MHAKKSFWTGQKQLNPGSQDFLVQPKPMYVNSSGVKAFAKVTIIYDKVYIVQYSQGNC